MKRLLIVLLLLLASCEQAVQTIPTGNYTPSVFDESERPVDPCATVSCSSGQHCLNGACVCDTGKPCGNKCIAASSCCTNADCSTQNCANNTCLPAKECTLGEELLDGNCACTEDRVFCKEQNKCIKKGDCCYFGNCPAFQRCQRTTYRTSFCVEVDGKKTCKSLGEVYNTTTFTFGTLSVKSHVSGWMSDKTLKFSVNDQEYRLAANDTQTLGSARFYQEGVEVLGGKCEPDDTD